MYRYFWLVLLTLCASMIFASEDDGGLSVSDFDLNQAIDAGQLENLGNLTYSNNSPFSGVSYNMYPDGSIQGICQYSNGEKNGFNVLFYPNTKKELEASYRNGMLHGRFRGWDESGELLYDLWFDRGMMKRDLMLDSRVDDLIEMDEDIIDADGKESRDD